MCSVIEGRKEWGKRHLIKARNITSIYMHCKCLTLDSHFFGVFYLTARPLILWLKRNTHLLTRQFEYLMNLNPKDLPCFQTISIGVGGWLNSFASHLSLSLSLYKKLINDSHSITHTLSFSFCFLHIKTIPSIYIVGQIHFPSCRWS